MEDHSGHLGVKTVMEMASWEGGEGGRLPGKSEVVRWLPGKREGEGAHLAVPLFDQ